MILISQLLVIDFIGMSQKLQPMLLLRFSAQRDNNKLKVHFVVFPVRNVSVYRSRMARANVLS